MNHEIENFEGKVPVHQSQYLSFLLAGEEYAVEILRVREIRGWEESTPIPNAAYYVKGMINLRGAIVPVIDLRDRFSLPKEPYGPRNVVIVVQVEGADKPRTIGLVADAVSDVHNIPEGSLCDPPETGGSVDVDYILGIGTVEQKMVIVLDVDRLLAGDGNGDGQTSTM